MKTSLPALDWRFHAPHSTLAARVGTCGVKLQPLADALRQVLMSRPVLHADETPVAMLAPGKGKTHQAYFWSHGTTEFDPIKAVLYDFTEGRVGEHVRRVLNGWTRTLACDDVAGYKALFKGTVTEAGCMAHARRELHHLSGNHQSTLAKEAFHLFGALYDMERSAGELDADQSHRLRPLRSTPISDTMLEWLTLHRRRATDGTAMAKAIDYSLGRWVALTRCLDDGALPIDNHWIENRIRPIASILTNSCAMCSSGCRRIRTAGSKNCCRIAGLWLPGTTDHVRGIAAGCDRYAITSTWPQGLDVRLPAAFWLHT
jgi:transposase